MDQHTEKPVVFSCAGESLAGIVHCAADQYKTEDKIGVVIVVGGPQYRAGSHRQFVLLARGLARNGLPVFRFDCRGMGDSSGEFPGFEAINDDIEAAISIFMIEQPQLERIILWGLCDGASAACFYAHQDKRVSGLVLANPWVRTEQSEAQAYIKHYYLKHLRKWQLWHKLFSGQFDFRASLASLKNNLMKAKNNKSPVSEPLPERVFNGLSAFTGKALLILSGNDLTAAEFMDTVNTSSKWRKLLGSDQIERVDLKRADHTFSCKQDMEMSIKITADWLVAE